MSSLVRIREAFRRHARTETPSHLFVRAQSLVAHPQPVNMSLGFTIHQTAFHPAPVLLFQLLTTGVTLGLSCEDSLARPASLPLVAACVWDIVATSRHFVRPQWVSLISVFSFGLLLQHVDLALLTTPTEHILTQTPRPRGHPRINNNLGRRLPGNA